ncbi:MAG: tetratricopeptide repeat protein [Sedimentisphaerales bacterium]|nr:tetratricopeptide repeat protein [Sedimentisphaerales bacterium]
MGNNSSNKILITGVVAIVLGCFIAYLPAIKAGFIWDDDIYVTANPLLTAPDGLYRIWLTADSPSQYFPLTYTTFLIEHKLWGFNPAGYHAVNVGIHIINALLIWAILRRLNIPGAWFASAVFALHPVQVESVAWVTERKNVLMLLFSLLSILCWIESVAADKFGSGNSKNRKKNHLYICSILFCALALFSKATACTLPIALILILWFKGIPFTIRRLEQIIPYIAMGIGIAILVMWWEKHHQGTGFVDLGLTPADKLIIAGRALWFYLAKVFWPVNLTFSYPRWQIDTDSIAQYARPAGFCLLIICAWLLRKRLGRGLLAGLLFFSGMLFPMLGFFPLYTFVYSFVADHYQYMSAIGPIAIVSAGCAYLYRRVGYNQKTILLSAAGVLLFTLGVLTYRQCRIYTDKQTLWEDTLNKNRDSWLAQSQLADISFRQGKLEQARSYLERTIELASYLRTIHPRAYSDFYSNLAAIDQKQGRLEDAAGNYLKSLEIFENFALTHYRLAEIFVKLGRPEEAKAHLRRAIEIAEIKKADNLAEELRSRLESLGDAAGPK